MSPTKDEIRKEVDEVVAAVHGIVTTLKGGVNPMSLVTCMPNFMEILNTGQAFQALTKEEKATFFGEVFDALSGTDQYSLFDHVGPVGPESTEKLMDAMKDAVVETILSKLQ